MSPFPREQEPPDSAKTSTPDRPRFTIRRTDALKSSDPGSGKRRGDSEPERDNQSPGILHERSQRAPGPPGTCSRRCPHRPTRIGTEFSPSETWFTRTPDRHDDPERGCSRKTERRTSDENKAQEGEHVARSHDRTGVTDPGAEENPEAGEPGGSNSRGDQRRAGKGCGDAVRLRTGGLLRGVEASRERFGRIRNAMNSRIGSRMQQACNFRVRQAVEPVRNREDGTLKSA